MTKLLKFLLSLILILILLIVIGAVALVLFVDPNKYKDQISHAVYAKTGYQVNLKGDMGWSFYPWLNLKLKDVDIQNPANKSNVITAHLNTANIEVKLLPLLHKKVEINGLSMDGIINYKNQKTNQNIVLNNFELHSNSIAENSDFPVDAQFNLQANKPAIQGLVKLNGDVNADITNKTYQLKQTKLTLKLNGDALSNQALNTILNVDMAANLKQRSAQGTIQTDKIQFGNMIANNVNAAISAANNVININPLTADIYQGNFAGKLTINNKEKSPHYMSNLQFTNIQTGPLFKDLANISHIQLSGTGNLIANLTTQGDNKKCFIKKLNRQW